MAEINEHGDELLYWSGTVLMISPHTPPTVVEAQARNYAAEEEQFTGDQPNFKSWRQVSTLISESADLATTPRRLQIVEGIAVGHERSQVVLCDVVMIPGQLPVRLVAKIFDPRYYRWEEDGLRNNFASYLVEEVTLDYSH